MMPLSERLLRASLSPARLMLMSVPISVSRWLQSSGEIFGLMPRGVRRERVQANGVPCEWLIPENSAPDKVLFYLHGGGFIFGLYTAHRLMISQLAKSAGVRALVVDYRLAPEYPFPAGLEDCVTAYRWLLQQGIASQNVVIGGDSAGGNFALAVMVKLREIGVSLPGAAVCISGVLDMEYSGESYAHATDPLLHAEDVRMLIDFYVGQNDRRDPLLSPLVADLRGFPPLLVQVGECEVLRSDAERLAAKANAVGVSVCLTVYPQMWHVWHLFAPYLKQAVQAIDEIADFIRQQLTT